MTGNRFYIKLLQLYRWLLSSHSLLGLAVKWQATNWDYYLQVILGRHVARNQHNNQESADLVIETIKNLRKQGFDLELFL